MNRTRLGSVGGGKEMWVGRRKRQEEGAGGWGSGGQESGEETGFLWGHQGPCGSRCSCLPSEHGPILPRGAQETVCACGFPSLPAAQVDTGDRLTKETTILGRKVRELLPSCFGCWSARRGLRGHQGPTGEEMLLSLKAGRGGGEGGSWDSPHSNSYDVPNNKQLCQLSVSCSVSCK